MELEKINLQKGEKERIFIELYQYGITQNTIHSHGQYCLIFHNIIDFDYEKY